MERRKLLITLGVLVVVVVLAFLVFGRRGRPSKADIKDLPPEVRKVVEQAQKEAGG